jgi:hypothetical protein
MVELRMALTNCRDFAWQRAPGQAESESLRRSRGPVSRRRKKNEKKFRAELTRRVTPFRSPPPAAARAVAGLSPAAKQVRPLFGHRVDTEYFIAEIQT